MAESQPMHKLIPMDMTPSRIFIVYDEIIKQPGLYILRMIRDKYPDKFKDFIDVQFLSDIPDKDLPYIYAARPEPNPLLWLSIKDFDYDANYKSLCRREKGMYLEMPFTSLNNHMDYFLRTFFITDIYFWTREYDKRVDFDIQLTYNDRPYANKVKYVTGPLNKCITQLTLDMVYYPIIDDNTWTMIRENKNIVFAIPNYAYNMNYNNLLKGQTDQDDNVGFYPVIEQDKPHFLG